MVLLRRLRRMGDGDRLHPRLRRDRDGDGGAGAFGLHGRGGSGADVRHLARAGKRRPLASGHDRPGERGGDEDDGRRSANDCGRLPRCGSLRTGHRQRQLSADLGAAHPADHRDPFGEFHHRVDRHQLWPRPSDQAAGRLRGLRNLDRRRRSRPVRPRAHPNLCGCGASAPHGLRPLRARHRPKSGAQPIWPA